MIAIIDYGVGNIFSLKSSLDKIGAEAVLTGSRETIEKCDRIILPGVGAFGDAIALLKKNGLDGIIKEECKKGKPLLGICLGMQLLFEKSFEYGEREGLGLIKGSVVPMEGAIPKELKIPHIGWNSLLFPKNREKSRLFKYISEGSYVYFVHSYFGTNCKESVSALTEYGAELTAAVERKNVFGVQFHPEKSGDVGLNILKGFCEL